MTPGRGFDAMKTAVAVVLAALTAAACQRYTVHPWHGDAGFDREAVQFVAPAKLSRVREELEDDAIRQLTEVPFVRLSPASFASLSDEPKALADHEIAYLLRGVTWSRPPMFSVVALNAAQGVLHVVQYDYSGELLIPFMVHESVAYPVIAILDREIVDVRSGAVTGGDAAMRWQSVYGEYAWVEKR